MRPNPGLLQRLHREGEGETPKASEVGHSRNLGLDERHLYEAQTCAEGPTDTDWEYAGPRLQPRDARSLLPILLEHGRLDCPVVESSLIAGAERRSATDVARAARKSTPIPLPESGASPASLVTRVQCRQPRSKSFTTSSPYCDLYVAYAR